MRVESGLPCRKTLLLALIAAASLALAAPAQAAWRRAQLNWQYYAFGVPYDTGGSPGQCQVGSGKTDCGAFYSYFHIIAEPSAIEFNYHKDGTWSPSDLSLAPTIYNGIAINVSSRGSITSVTIDPSTNLAGFDASRISFTAKQIQVDWQNLSFTKRTKVKLDVEFSRSPSPAGAKLTDTPPRP